VGMSHDAPFLDADDLRDALIRSGNSYVELSAGGARRTWSKRRHRNSARWYRRDCVVGTRRSISGVLNTICDRNLVRAIGPEYRKTFST
jgi:hypothetical protein